MISRQAASRSLATARATPRRFALAAPTLCLRHHRSIHASTDTPSSKICAVPFQHTPETVKERLLVHGLLASGHWPNILYAGLLHIFGGTLVESLAKEFGLGQSLRMRDLKPVYWPVWRMDVVAEGKASSARSEGEVPGWLAVREGYVPGHPFAPLSYLSFAVPPLVDDLPIYYPARHLEQFGKGNEIVEVPFTVPPFEFLDKLRYRIGNRASLNGMRIDVSKWKDTLTAAYPIYFPIYVAEFEHTMADGNKRTYNVVMDGHDDVMANCRTSFPPPMEMRASGKMHRNYWANPAPFLPSANFMIPAEVWEDPSRKNRSPAAYIAQYYKRWMSPNPDGNTIAASPTLSVAEADGKIDWSDPRIQRWSGFEREENGQYMEKGLEVHKTISALQTMVSLGDGLPEGADAQATVISSSSGGMTTKPVSEMRRDMMENIKGLKAELEAVKPDWLVEYEAAKSIGEEKKDA